MGKSYPSWVGITLEFGDQSVTYYRYCRTHEQETSLFAEAKRRFAEHCRTTPDLHYDHNKVRSTDSHTENEPKEGTKI